MRCAGKHQCYFLRDQRRHSGTVAMNEGLPAPAKSVATGRSLGAAGRIFVRSFSEQKRQWAGTSQGDQILHAQHSSRGRDGLAQRSRGEGA
eukprot:1526744-Rhodomonas_salina.1